MQGGTWYDSVPYGIDFLFVATVGDYRQALGGLDRCNRALEREILTGLGKIVINDGWRLGHGLGA